MMFYTAKDTWMPCEWQKDTTNLLVGFCKSEDLIYMQKQMHLFSKNTIKEVLGQSDDKKVNKVDTYYGYVFGILYLFTKYKQDTPKISFYIVLHTLLIVCDDETCLQELQKEILQLDPGVCTLEKTLRAVLEYVLFHVERQLDEVENEMTAFDEKISSFDRGIATEFREYRRLMLRMSHFMEQILDVCENLLEDENTFFHTEHLHQLKIAKDKAVRIEERVRMMEEYIEQLKEEFQFHQDYKLNQTMYVLNFAGELCPMDVVGEIYIGGVGVAQGYCGDTEKTEAAFIQHDHLGRIYKTGDMGVLRKEGYIEFLGRIDNQVKIRGYRIELGEIESAINNVPGIEKSVISYVVNRTGNKQLIAYYIPTSNDLASETIKESIGAFLPEYMVPQHYISIKELPLSANGKIDRSKLPELNLDKKERALSKDVISPLQKTLLGIWQKVFENTEITITDDFYGLGGDSIVLMKLLDEIALAGLENISIEDILEYETIEALSAYMEENK